MLKIFLLLYADDIVIFANSAEGLQSGLDLLSVYCKRWKLWKMKSQCLKDRDINI